MITMIIEMIKIQVEESYYKTGKSSVAYIVT